MLPFSLSISSLVPGVSSFKMASTLSGSGFKPCAVSRFWPYQGQEGCRQGLVVDGVPALAQGSKNMGLCRCIGFRSSWWQLPSDLPSQWAHPLE